MSGRGVMSYFFNSLRGSSRDNKKSLRGIRLQAGGMMKVVCTACEEEKRFLRPLK
jgi:hypothetical protein